MAGKFSYVFFDQSEFTHRVTGFCFGSSLFLAPAPSSLAPAPAAASFSLLLLLLLLVLLLLLLLPPASCNGAETKDRY